MEPHHIRPDRRHRSVLCAILLAATPAFTCNGARAGQPDPGAPARRAAAQLDFANRLQGKWTCSGRARDGAPYEATMLLFTVKPGTYEFELTPQPASAQHPNVIETWTWEWSYASHGSWWATPDKRTADAGVQYTSGGWDGTRLVWTQHVLGSRSTHTFERTPNGTLLFAIADGAGDRSDAPRLICRRTPSR